MDAHFTEKRTIIPACQDIGVAVPQRDQGWHQSFHLAAMCASSVPEIARRGFTYQARSYLKGLQRHEAVDKLRGRIRSLAVCQSAAKGLTSQAGQVVPRPCRTIWKTFVVR